jgi:chromatin assembly factor 1 subunit B
MKVKTLQIHWHNKQPIYSVDFNPQNPQKLVTCGGDNNIRVIGIC